MEERYSSLLENAGKPPLKSKILAVSKTVGVSSLSPQIVRRANMLFVFYKTPENKKELWLWVTLMLMIKMCLPIMSSDLPEPSAGLPNVYNFSKSSSSFSFS